LVECDLKIFTGSLMKEGRCYTNILSTTFCNRDQ
jgi:hypothetical protein